MNAYSKQLVVVQYFKTMRSLKENGATLNNIPCFGMM
jgi:hypothetical protein